MKCLEDCYSSHRIERTLPVSISISYTAETFSFYFFFFLSLCLISTVLSSVFLLYSPLFQIFSCFSDACLTPVCPCIGNTTCGRMVKDHQ